MNTKAQSSPPANTGFNYAELGDSRICYQITGSGNRPLLLLHTFRTQIEHTERIAPLLADRYRIYRIDLPGHGRSTKGGNQVQDCAYFVSTVRRFIESLGLTELTIVGESIGATIGLCLAAEIPQRLASVFAVNPYDYPASVIGGFFGKQVNFLARYTTLVIHMGIAPVLHLVFRAGFHAPTNIPKGYMKMLATVPARDKAFAPGLQSIIRHSASWSQTADRLYPEIPAQLPTFVIYGDSDWGPADSMATNRQRLGNAAEFCVLENTGHFSFLDNPQGVAEIILKKV